MPRILLMGLALLLLSAPAGAQELPAEPDPATVSVRLGPLYLHPAISLSNLGIDRNVFNDAIEDEPKHDFTLTADPNLDLWLRVGRTWFNGQLGEQINWYQKYGSERSSNSRINLGWSVPLNRLAFRFNGSYVSTRERPGFEIDTRAHRTEKGLGVAGEFRALAKTHLGARVARTKVDYDADEFYRKQNLRISLNRTATDMALTVRNEITPLTSLTVDIGRAEDRFEFEPLRNSDSTSITAGLQFDPLALLKGRARFGYRDFKPLAPSVPGYAGAVVGVDLTYIVLGSTQFNVQVNRDVEYSFDVSQPYYIQTAFSASLAQQVFGPLDVVGRFGMGRLGYRDRIGATVEAPNRVDRTNTYGGGLGYHVGRDLRIGLNVDQSQRESPIDNRRYEGLRFGTSVTYGR